MAGTIRVLWDSPTTATVNIYTSTNRRSGRFKVNGEAVSFPYALTQDTAFVTEANDKFTVSVVVSGTEIAAQPDGVRVVDLSANNSELIFAPAFDDPGKEARAIIAAGGGGGGGDVASVNGQIGAVSLDATDVGARADDWVPDWTDVANKPASFTPSTHAHAVSEVTGLQAALDAKAASTHAHPASDISNSTSVGRSVLTAADAAAARTAIGAGTSNLAIGTTASTAKAGNYAPAAADISDSTATGRSVLTAASQSAARTAIGAGTSSLALGTTGSTAKAGNWTPGYADVPAGSTIAVFYSAGWPARPTARTDVCVMWIGGDEGNSPSGGVTGKDVWIRSAV